MPGLLGSQRATREQREQNAAHNSLLVVLSVLGMLALYAYLVTHVATAIGLPLPEEQARRAGLVLEHVFDDDHNVDSEIWIDYGNKRFSNDDQRLVLFAVVAAAFLCAYFLPVRYKHASLVFWFLVAALVLFGLSALAGLLSSHLMIYLLFHTPPPRQRMAISAAAGALLGLALGELGGDFGQALAWSLAAILFYGYVVPSLLWSPKVMSILRTLAIQSPLIVGLVGALAEGLRGAAWKLPLGVLLFFWQWMRLMMYHVDYKNGQVPQDLPLISYLSVFLSPAVLPNWTRCTTIGQGYAYLDNNFLAEDKNRLALDGVKIWGVALIYLVFGDWMRYLLVDLFSALGVNVHNANIRNLVCGFVKTGSATTASVLLTTLLDLVRWFMFWAVSTHFKTGLWRVFGYRMDPYFDRPWRATNLVSFWSRFTFHYREFLVRAFYYPVFFRWFKNHTRLRIVAATMAAACFGNLIWGHLAEVMYYRDIRFENIGYILQSWPYFVLLGLGISFTELYLLSKKSLRKPWTLDWRISFDLLATYLTVQFYALIHVFLTPCAGGTLTHYTRLFLIGLGFSL